MFSSGISKQYSPFFVKKRVCEAKMVANFKNAFLIFRKEIFIYRFF